MANKEGSKAGLTDTETVKVPAAATQAASSPAPATALEDDIAPQAVYSPDDDAPMRPIHEDADEEGGPVPKISAPVEEDDDESREEVDRAQRRKLPGYSNAQELMTNELPARATYADAKLRSNLVGSIIVFLKDLDERYLFDWSTETLRTGKVESPTADCTIRLTSHVLLRIAQGDLNPQIAMLSDKISVQGKAGMAVYFFNLIAPRVQH